ncbi:hypothetical protein, partial [Vibrio cholerae]|uniref:hypothetical protein n=1 Tax=Vibrio cholerae TaxID=666 RepID=UPI001C8DA496
RKWYIKIIFATNTIAIILMRFQNLLLMYNARLRGWQRITLNSIATTETTAAQWDWKRRALTVPLEAFVSLFCF